MKAIATASYCQSTVLGRFNDPSSSSPIITSPGFQNDDVDEADGDLIITFTAVEPGHIIKPGTSTITIRIIDDDDPPAGSPMMSIAADASANEAAGDIPFTIQS